MLLLLYLPPNIRSGLNQHGWTCQPPSTSSLMPAILQQIYLQENWTIPLLLLKFKKSINKRKKVTNEWIILKELFFATTILTTAFNDKNKQMTDILVDLVLKTHRLSTENVNFSTFLMKMLVFNVVESRNKRSIMQNLNSFKHDRVGVELLITILCFCSF